MFEFLNFQSHLGFNFQFWIPPENGEVRMVEDEEGEVEVPVELRPTTLSNNVLRFPREED